MSLMQLVAEYGYLAVFLGALLEGETVLVLAGYAAHQGYLSLPLVVVTALCAGALGDQGFFLVGRRYGTALLQRYPKLEAGAQRVDRMLVRFQTPVILGIRFMYGLRVAGPIALGMSAVPTWRFVLFNLIGAAIWAPLVVGTGYLFGQTLEWVFADIRRYEEAAVLTIVGVAVAFALFRRLRRHVR
ncbi:DedA family protein [Azotobacter bryophylli]|uniref:DedA family protein n=1 Tax=Azotobacter bryophylli TaxID=1986537 RepID=A0ABV7AVN6_9GAMM